MAYVKDGYTLHQHKKKTYLMFFAKPGNKKGKPIDLPKGYKVITNKRTGLPMVKKK